MKIIFDEKNLEKKNKTSHFVFLIYFKALELAQKNNFTENIFYVLNLED